ncbi:MAG: DUF166 family protein [Candidatus Helarchaeota archaeon]
MKIGILSDGKYGERAFQNISKKFECEWIQLEEIPSNIILDDYEIDIPECDLYISYLRHPDQIFALAELGKPTLLGISFGEGFLRQLQDINPKVLAFPTMCSIEPITDIQEIDEFGQCFGRPNFKIEVEGDIIKNIEVLRSSPCGSSKVAPNYLIGKKISVSLFQDFAIHVCHECRAPRFGRTCDKELSGLIHIRALIKSLEENDKIRNNEVSDFIESIEQEYDSKLKNHIFISQKQKIH